MVIKLSNINYLNLFPNADNRNYLKFVRKFVFVSCPF